MLRHHHLYQSPLRTPFRESAHSETLTDGVQFHAAADHIAANVQGLDNFIAQIARSVPVDFIPGHADPTNFGMPQQPFHPCLMPSCMGFGEALMLLQILMNSDLGMLLFLGMMDRRHQISSSSRPLLTIWMLLSRRCVGSTLHQQHLIHWTVIHTSRTIPLSLITLQMSSSAGAPSSLRPEGAHIGGA